MNVTHSSCSIQRSSTGKSQLSVVGEVNLWMIPSLVTYWTHLHYISHFPLTVEKDEIWSVGVRTLSFFPPMGSLSHRSKTPCALSVHSGSGKFWDLRHLHRLVTDRPGFLGCWSPSSRSRDHSREWALKDDLTIWTSCIYMKWKERRG